MKHITLSLLFMVAGFIHLKANKEHHSFLRSIQDTAAEKSSYDYRVQVNGQEKFVYRARVSAMPVDVSQALNRPLEQTEIAAFCYFEVDHEKTITVKSAADIKTVVIRPLSMHIKPVIRGNEISFKLYKPCQIVVEVNGWHKALHLFANPSEKKPFSKTGKNDLYFGPGVHYPGVIFAKSNQTIYIASGAVVHGAISGKNISNLNVRGEGILDGSLFRRNIDTMTNILVFVNCRNVSVSGIILRDPPAWTFMTFECMDVTIDNIKLIGMWRYNSDGIDLLNSSNVEIKNSFVRAFDDCITIKGGDVFRNAPENSLW
ncbi:MAG TPA: glycosyl hydrolase family 28 protein, partial [Puia sp.]